MGGWGGVDLDDRLRPLGPHPRADSAARGFGGSQLQPGAVDSWVRSGNDQTVGLEVAQNLAAVNVVLDSVDLARIDEIAPGGARVA